MRVIARHVWGAVNTFTGIAACGAQFLGPCQIVNLAGVPHAATCVIIAISIRVYCQRGTQFRCTIFAALANCNVYKV